MKNRLQPFLLLVLASIPISILFSQESSLLDLQFIPTEDAHLYIPDNGDPIALWKKSDLKFSIATRKNNNMDYNDYSNYDATLFKLGYSFLPNFYATLSWFETKGDVYQGAFYEERMTLGDFGIGAYLVKLDTKTRKIPFLKYNSKWMMEKGIHVSTLLGYSRANISHKRNFRFGQSEFNFNRFYGQVGFQFQRGIWGVSGNGKFGVLNYQNVVGNGNAIIDLEPMIDLIMKQNNFLFMESSVRFYLGTKFGQVYINKVFSKIDGTLSDFVLTDYTNVGILLDIEGIFKKKEKE